MRIEVILAAGGSRFVEIEHSREIAKHIGADVCDTVNLRDGRFMYVDDLGHQRRRPVNAKATALYHGVCIPGTTHQIVGDVAIVRERRELL